MISLLNALVNPYLNSPPLQHWHCWSLLSWLFGHHDILVLCISFCPLCGFFLCLSHNTSWVSTAPFTTDCSLSNCSECYSSTPMFNFTQMLKASPCKPPALLSLLSFWHQCAIPYLISPVKYLKLSLKPNSPPPHLSLTAHFPSCSLSQWMAQKPENKVFSLLTFLCLISPSTNQSSRLLHSHFKEPLTSFDLHGH